MKIIDSHVHFWQPDVLHYPWLHEVKALNQPFTPEHLFIETVGLDIAGIVFVQADCLPEQSLQEVKWITSLASNTPIQAIVAAAPLEIGNAVEPLLESYKAHPLVKGIRRLIQSQPAGFATSANFISGVQHLARYQLSFDICIRPNQINEIIDFVRRCPDVMFVVDHCGKPDIANHCYEPWCEQIQNLAKSENVSMKISGLVTEADPANWTRDDLKPFIDHVIETFGIQRVMFGSDWPVCTLAASYTQWLDTLLWATERLTETEKHLLFFENANRFYRLG